MLMFGIYILLSAMAGTWADATKYFDKDKWYYSLLYGGGAVLVLFIVGLVIGKTTSASTSRR
jgi:hypothetical protein